MRAASADQAGVGARSGLTKIRFNHIWAEAFIPQEAYRGVDEGSTQKSWSPLDASIKENEFVDRAIAFRSLANNGMTNWLDQFLDGSTFVSNDGSVDSNGSLESSTGFIAPSAGFVSGITEEFSTEIRTGLSDLDLDSLRIVDFTGGQRIRRVVDSYLPSTTPFSSKAISGEFREIPSSLQASIQLEIGGSDPVDLPTFGQQTESGASTPSITVNVNTRDLVTISKQDPPARSRTDDQHRRVREGGCRGCRNKTRWRVVAYDLGGPRRTVGED